jgi:O-antigen/teichoic acid export membrane protein
VRSPFRVRFVRDVFVTSGTQAVKGALMMIAGIVVARYFGASARGTLAVLVALGSMTVLLGTLGIHTSSVYFMGRFADVRNEVVSNNVVVATAGGVVAAGLLAAAGVLFRAQLLAGIAPKLFFLFVISVPCMYFNSFAQRIILGAGRVPASNLPDLLEGVGFLATAIGVLTFSGARLQALVVARVAVEALITVVLVAYVRRLISFRFRLYPKLLWEQLRYGSRNYASSLLWLCLLQSDLILCNIFLGSSKTGVYSVAVSLGLPVTMLGNAVGTVTFQRVSAQHVKERRIENTNRTLRLLVPMALVPMVVFGLLADRVVPFIYGGSFRGAAPALILLLPGLFAFCLEIVVMNFLAGEGSPSIVYRAPFTGLAVNLVANLFVIPRWGIDGAAVTSSVAYVLVLCLVLRNYLISTDSSIRDMALLRVGDIRALLGFSGGWSGSPVRGMR